MLLQPIANRIAVSISTYTMFSACGEVSNLTETRIFTCPKASILYSDISPVFTQNLLKTSCCLKTIGNIYVYVYFVSKY